MYAVRASRDVFQGLTFLRLPSCVATFIPIVLCRDQFLVSLFLCARCCATALYCKHPTSNNWISMQAFWSCCLLFDIVTVGWTRCPPHPVHGALAALCYDFILSRVGRTLVMCRSDAMSTVYRTRCTYRTLLWRPRICCVTCRLDAMSTAFRTRCTRPSPIVIRLHETSTRVCSTTSSRDWTRLSTSSTRATSKRRCVLLLWRTKEVIWVCGFWMSLIRILPVYGWEGSRGQSLNFNYFVLGLKNTSDFKYGADIVGNRM